VKVLHPAVAVADRVEVTDLFKRRPTDQHANRQSSQPIERTNKDITKWSFCQCSLVKNGTLKNGSIEPFF
jgi:hypothetical protein